MKFEMGPERDFFRGRHHWRFTNLRDSNGAMDFLRQNLERARFKCEGDNDEFIGRQRMIKFDVLREADVITIRADYGRLLMFFPQMVFIAFAVIGVALAIIRRDPMWLTLLIAGVIIGGANYVFDAARVPRRQLTIVSKILLVADENTRREAILNR